MPMTASRPHCNTGVREICVRAAPLAPLPSVGHSARLAVAARRPLLAGRNLIARARSGVGGARGRTEGADRARASAMQQESRTAL
eukprot:2472182-Prymnesium_polylepis.1